MDKNAIMEVLNDWNFWKHELKSGIRRDSYLRRLNTILATDQIIVITGPRRAGKSFIMRQFATELISTGIPRKNILMINFEDPRLTKLDTKELQKIYETYLELLNPDKIPYIFLDEVQEVKQWEKWVNTMHELGKAHIIISGSNAKLLSRELSTLLTGRHLNLTVYPLSFAEYLYFNNITPEDELDYTDKKIEIKRLFGTYLEFGSFPKVVLSDEKKQLLIDYYDDVLNKDLIRRHKVRKPEQLKALARFYFSNASSPITFSSIEKFLSISADTIEKFSGYLEEAYFLSFVKRFSPKLKEQEKSPRKVYPIDTGLAGAAGFGVSGNKGNLAECVVFLRLAQLQAESTEMEIYYWKDDRHREVDFIVKKGLEIISLIQVCWNISQPATRARETRILARAMDEFAVKEGLVITEDHEATEEIDDKKIRFIPIWKWLLMQKVTGS